MATISILDGPYSAITFTGAIIIILFTIALFIFVIFVYTYVIDTWNTIQNVQGQIDAIVAGGIFGIILSVIEIIIELLQDDDVILDRESVQQTVSKLSSSQLSNLLHILMNEPAKFKTTYKIQGNIKTSKGISALERTIDVILVAK